MNREIKIEKDLLSVLDLLQSCFDDDLYIVGGAVREGLSENSAKTDVDLTGRFLPDEIKNILEKSPFKVCDTSPKMGTLKISYNNVSFEYTTFRKDSYGIGGKHTPDSVVFTRDLVEDSLRRDFTVNAIYYSLKSHSLVDPLDGIKDIDAKILRATKDPKSVLSEDGLRLMRLVRFASTLGYEIDEETIKSAKENVGLIRDIAPERIREEFDKILVADTVKNICGAQIRGLRLLDEIGLLNILIPEFEDCKGFPQNKNYHKYNVDEHILKAVLYAPPRLRLVALFHDMGKPRSQQKYGHSKMHGQESSIIAKEFMEKFRYPKDDVKRTIRLITFHMYDLRCDTEEKDLRIFIQENIDIIGDLIDFKKADAKAKGLGDTTSYSAIRMENTLAKMQEDGVPFSIKELKIDGRDLIRCEIPPQRRSMVLKEIFNKCSYDKTLLSRDGQLEELLKYSQR